MSTSYRAKTYLGIQIKVGDFLLTEGKDWVTCDHPEAEGNRFCPVCGTQEDERRGTETVHVPTPLYDEVLVRMGWTSWFEEKQPTTLQELMEETEGFPVGGLSVKNIAASHYSDPEYILGQPVSQAGGNPASGENPSIQAAEALLDQIETIKAKLAKLPFSDRPLRFYTVLHAS